MDALPTLSVEGFTTNKTIIMLKLYEYFLSSDYSQSNTFFGDIASLKYLVSEESDPTRLKEDIINALDKMYSAYFDDVNIIVDVIEEDNKVSFNIDISGTSDGETYKLSKNVHTINNNVVNFDKQQETYHET